MFASFDNPVTCKREIWVNGELKACVSFDYLARVGSGMDIASGSLIGNISALPQELIQHVRWISRMSW